MRVAVQRYLMAVVIAASVLLGMTPAPAEAAPVQVATTVEAFVQPVQYYGRPGYGYGRGYYGRPIYRPYYGRRFYGPRPFYGRPFYPHRSYERRFYR